MSSNAPSITPARWRLRPAKDGQRVTGGRRIGSQYTIEQNVFATDDYSSSYVPGSSKQVADLIMSPTAAWRKFTPIER